MTQYSPRGQVTRPQSINFMTQLLFDLDISALIIASRTNLESGSRFTEVWFPSLEDVYDYLLPVLTISYLLTRSIKTCFIGSYMVYFSKTRKAWWHIGISSASRNESLRLKPWYRLKIYWIRNKQDLWDSTYTPYCMYI